MRTLKSNLSFINIKDIQDKALKSLFVLSFISILTCANLVGVAMNHEQRLVTMETKFKVQEQFALQIKQNNEKNEQAKKDQFQKKMESRKYDV